MDPKAKFLFGAVVMTICVATAGLLTVYFSPDLPNNGDGTSEVDKKVTDNRNEIWRGNRAESSIQPGFASDSGFKGLESPEDYDNGEYQNYFDIANLEYDEVLEIALQQIEIQEFIDDIDSEYDTYAWFDYDNTWFVDFYPWNYWDAFAYVAIDDSTEEVLEIFTWNGKDLDITEEEIMDIILENPVIKEFLDAYPNVESYIYYEFFGFWSINFYKEDWSDNDYNDNSYVYEYIYAVFDAVSEEILEIYSSFAPGNLNLNEDSAMEIVMAEPEIAEFVEDHPDYYCDTGVYLYYGEEPYAIWYLNFQTYLNWDVEGEVTSSDTPTGEVSGAFWDYSYAFVSVDDATGEILYMEVYSWHEAILTEDEVLEIVAPLAEIQEFLNVFPDAEVDVYYDYYGEWKVMYSVPYLWNAWVHVSIDDETGEVLFVDTNIPDQLPQMAYEEVLNVVLATPEAQNFTEEYPNATIYAYYYYGGYYVEYSDEQGEDKPTSTSDSNDGYWYVELSNSVFIYLDDTFNEEYIYFDTGYEALCFTIDDSTGYIIAIDHFTDNWGWIEPILTEDKVSEIASEVPEIQEFLEQVPEAEVYVSYDYYGT